MKHADIIIFCDGSCLRNPDGPSGWAVIVALGDKVFERGGHEPSSTNNRMEMLAAIEGLAAIPVESTGWIVVMSDSKYVIDGITKWVPGWKRRNWITSEKKPVLNRDLWERLDGLYQRVIDRITWHHVPGHAGIAGNERCDEIAATFARSRTPKLYNGTRNGYRVNLVSHLPKGFHKNPPPINGTQPNDLVPIEADTKVFTQETPEQKVIRLEHELNVWRSRAESAERELHSLRMNVSDMTLSPTSPAPNPRPS